VGGGALPVVVGGVPVPGFESLVGAVGTGPEGVADNVALSGYGAGTAEGSMG